MTNENDKQLEEISKQLKKVFNVVLNGSTEAIEKVTRAGAKEMRTRWGSERPDWGLPTNLSLPLAKTFSKPKDWKDYFSSWTSHTEKSRYPDELSKGTIYSKKYPLVHLLENGHVVVRNGVPTSVTHAFPHVAPIKNYCSELVEQELEKVMKKL